MAIQIYILGCTNFLWSPSMKVFKAYIYVKKIVSKIQDSPLLLEIEFLPKLIFIRNI